ncbi:hypothetical protein [Colwellia sp. 12G3]|uniref:hypothetical protein n=1 Tax=Colwellia sp. 12G3 TaxID=2058299 RepID=UPI000C345428|nr:hypothetical protein [Colwellia sp. 12G3]PKI16305.1 hypothetical protein CXF71_09990 [Colwellia sp. 12G3]
MNSSKSIIIWLVISTVLLFTYSGFSIWLPHYVEKQYEQSNKQSLKERVALIELAIEKTKSDDFVDKSQIIGVFESIIESEKSSELYISKLVGLFATISNILVGLLLIHLASLIPIFKGLVKKKT